MDRTGEVLEHALAARLAHLAPARRIGDEPGDGVREGPAVLGRHEEPGLARTTTSRCPGTSVATMARLAAMASSGASGNPSFSDVAT